MDEYLRGRLYANMPSLIEQICAHQKTPLPTLWGEGVESPSDGPAKKEQGLPLRHKDSTGHLVVINPRLVYVRSSLPPDTPEHLRFLNGWMHRWHSRFERPEDQRKTRTAPTPRTHRTIPFEAYTKKDALWTVKSSVIAGWTNVPWTATFGDMLALEIGFCYPEDELPPGALPFDLCLGVQFAHLWLDRVIFQSTHPVRLHILGTCYENSSRGMHAVAIDLDERDKSYTMRMPPREEAPEHPAHLELVPFFFPPHLV